MKLVVTEESLERAKESIRHHYNITTWPNGLLAALDALFVPETKEPEATKLRKGNDLR